MWAASLRASLTSDLVGARIIPLEWTSGPPRARGRRRSDAARLRLLPQRAGGPELSPAVPPAADAEADASPRGVRRQVHDRLPGRVPGELVRRREAQSGEVRFDAEFLRRQGLAIARRVAAAGLDPPAGSARLVPVVLP